MSSLDTLREAVAILVGAIALAGAVFLGAAHLKMHGHYHCLPGPSPGSCAPFYSYWTVGREWWQIPAAIGVAGVGLGAAFVLTKR
jgi:hypothetical protein